MISDTLSKAAHEIREYQENIPGAYNSIKDRLDALLTEMDAIRVILDTPPAIEITDAAEVC